MDHSELESLQRSVEERRAAMEAMKREDEEWLERSRRSTELLRKDSRKWFKAIGKDFDAELEAYRRRIDEED